MALIVRMDVAGFFLIDRAQRIQWGARLVAWTGSALVSSLPWVIRALGIIGTLAMLIVGGGMFTQNINALHHALGFMPSLLADLVLGLAVGGVLLGVQLFVQKIRTNTAVEEIR